MDRRQRKTREAIFAAFIALLSEKNYHQISVQEIIDAADVGRTTFYAHFETKDHLLKELCEGLFEHVIDSAVDHSGAHWHCVADGTQKPVFLHLIEHLEKNDNHILDLLSSENSGIFNRYFKMNLVKLIRAAYRDESRSEESSVPEDYRMNHIAAAFVETVHWWISRNRKESPEEITRYFLAVTQLPGGCGLGEADGEMGERAS